MIFLIFVPFNFTCVRYCGNSKTRNGSKDAVIKVQGTKLAWAGDQPKVHIIVDRMASYGWKAKLSSDQAVRVAVKRMLGKEAGALK